MAVASPAFAAMCNRCRFTVRDQVGQDLPREVIVNDGSHGQHDVDRFSSPPGAMRSATRLAVFCFVMPLIAEVEKGGEPVRGRKDNVSAIATVSSVRAAARDEHFPAEAAAAVSAATGFHGNTNFIDKHRTPHSIGRWGRLLSGGLLRGDNAVQEILPSITCGSGERNALVRQSWALGRR